MKVVCIGASYTLKKRDSKTWKNKTVTEVAALIAKQFKFKFVGEPSTRRFDQLSIAGQSYWSWLQEHAKQIGYSFYVDGTTMYMRPLNKQLKDAASNAPIMGLDIPSGAANQKHMDRTIDSFVIQKGDYFDFAANPYTIKSVSGVNPLTSKRIETKSSPTDSRAANTRAKASGPIFTDFGTEVVHSSAFSKAAAKDAAFAAKFNIMAKVRGQGDPRISPFGAVVLLNTGIDTDGFWAINKARHVFDITGLYEVELDIVTDGIGANSGDLFRKARGLVRGTIDIENALSAKLPRGADLIQRTPRFKETDQGFNDANSTWIGR
jgi:phage protein D